MRLLAVSGIVVLAVLHHDFWFWTDKRLVFGFLPVALAYHIGFVLLLSLFLAFLVRRFWPAELENLPSDPPNPVRS